MHVQFFIQLLLFISSCSCQASQATTNFTIDDEYGDELTGVAPTYSPAQFWQQGATCPGCALQPNATLAFDKTWHDSTYDAVRRPGIETINILFNGHAVGIYVYCIQGNGVTYDLITTDMHLVFTLDGYAAGKYDYTPNNQSYDFAYQVLIYSNPTLKAPSGGGQHNLTIQSYANILFDYAEYTLPEDSIPGPSVSPGTTSLSPTTATTPPATDGNISLETPTMMSGNSRSTNANVPPAVSSPSTTDTILSSNEPAPTSSHGPTSTSSHENNPTAISSSASSSTPPSASTSSPPARTGQSLAAVAGEAAGGTAALLCSIILFLYIRRYCRTHSRAAAEMEQARHISILANSDAAAIEPSSSANRTSSWVASLPRPASSRAQFSEAPIYREEAPSQLMMGGSMFVVDDTPPPSYVHTVVAGSSGQSEDGQVPSRSFSLPFAVVEK